MPRSRTRRSGAGPAALTALEVMSRLNRATEALDPPFAVVDMAAFRANGADMRRRASGKRIRVATKSLRCRRLISDALALPGFGGVLAFTLPEAIWLAQDGPGWVGLSDIVVGYPTVDRGALRQLGESVDLADRITLMIDDVAQLDHIESAANARSWPIRVCIDVDASWRIAQGRAGGGKVSIGAKRSPVHTPGQAAALAAHIVRRRGFALVGLMSYEAQIAGVGDAPAGRPIYGRAVHAMQSRSWEELAERRASAVASVSATLDRMGAAPLEFVNGGGTGSLDLAASEDCLTELAAGSGFFAPTLFDDYSRFSLRPAAAFALPVVRRPGAGMVTVLGGGYLASGPAAQSRLPRPWLPPGLALDPREGAGEVQTPLVGRVADQLAIGDRVWFRHAKAGELSERFEHLVPVTGDHSGEPIPTYRGEGRTFL